MEVRKKRKKGERFKVRMRTGADHRTLSVIDGTRKVRGQRVKRKKEAGRRRGRGRLGGQKRGLFIDGRPPKGGEHGRGLGGFG